MVAISTTPTQLYFTSKRKSFVVEADPGNSTNNVKISSVDPNVATSFVSLKAGQQQSFKNWKGTLWAVASANTPNVYIEFADADATGESFSSKSAGS